MPYRNYRANIIKTATEKYSPHLTAQNYKISSGAMSTTYQIIVPPTDEEGLGRSNT